MKRAVRVSRDDDEVLVRLRCWKQACAESPERVRGLRTLGGYPPIIPRRSGADVRHRDTGGRYWDRAGGRLQGNLNVVATQVGLIRPRKPSEKLFDAGGTGKADVVLPARVADK